MLDFKEVEDFDLKEWRRVFLSCINGRKVTFKQEQFKKYSAVNFQSMKKTQNSETIFKTCEQFAKLINGNIKEDKGVKVSLSSNIPKEGGEAVICFFEEEE